MLFAKPPKEISEHIDLLSSRGLEIANPSEAEHYLGNISYYRLSPYMLPFQFASGRGTHQFRPHTQFMDIVDLYAFDRELRLLLLNPLERIEIALRAQLTNTLALNHGPDCLSQRNLFDDRYKHDWLMATLQEKLKSAGAEEFLNHYRKKYTSPALPPIWMCMETLSFKEVTKIFRALRRSEDKQALVGHFGWPDKVLQSWFLSLADLRNVCAHHSRTWNRRYLSRPIIPDAERLPRDWYHWTTDISYAGMHVNGQARGARLVVMLVVIEALMRNISPTSRWQYRLQDLLRSRSPYQLVAMGLEPGWDQHPYWAMLGT